jgi:molybdopterin-containing oxidoreductase family iron-sulfur binding subunit
VRFRAPASNGESILVDYDFKSLLIVSVGADFLGDWQGGGYDSGYTQGSS